MHYNAERKPPSTNVANNARNESEAINTLKGRTQKRERDEIVKSASRCSTREASDIMINLI
jgi:hypothetical protein